MMTIDQAKRAKEELATRIWVMIEAFELETGTTVHNVYVWESKKGQPDRVTLNVGLTETEYARPQVPAEPVDVWASKV